MTKANPKFFFSASQCNLLRDVLMELDGEVYEITDQFDRAARLWVKQLNEKVGKA